MIELPIEALDAYLLGREQTGFSGVVRITSEREERFTGAYGFASRAWHISNTLETRFDTASITKLFTAVAALQIVEEGSLSLETQAVAYLGLEGTSIHPCANLGQLISHTSGIADDADEEAGEDYAAIWQERSSYMVRETSDFLPQFAHKPANFEPGQGCRYCNVGFILAGLMIEKATGMAYREYVRRRIFSPAQMTDADFLEMDVVAERVAEGVDREPEGGWRRNIYSFPPVGSPDSGAHVTAADLERFLIACQEGVLMSAEMTEAFFTPVAVHSVNPLGELRYGYGLEFQFGPTGDLTYYEKEGYNAGVSGFMRHYPASETTVVMLGNTSDSVWEPREYVHSLLTESTESR